MSDVVEDKSVPDPKPSKPDPESVCSECGAKGTVFHEYGDEHYCMACETGWSGAA